MFAISFEQHDPQTHAWHPITVMAVDIVVDSIDGISAIWLHLPDQALVVYDVIRRITIRTL